jgi:hypothetical protein
MAIVKPLVEKDGEIERLQAGDTLDVNADCFTRVFTVTTSPGAPVYSDTNTSVNLAQANSEVTSDLVGIAKEAVSAGQPGPVCHDGVVNLTTIQWDAITGQVGGLTLASKYFVSNAASGLMLAQGNLAGIGAGEYVVEVGHAISDTELLVRKVHRIKR